MKKIMQQKDFVEIECPLEITWKISKLSSRFYNFTKRRVMVIHSPNFRCPKFLDVEYRLSLEYKNDSCYKFTFYLSKTGINIEANFIAEVGGESQPTNHVFSQNGIFSGISCYQLKLNNNYVLDDRYFINKILTFKIKGTLKRTKPFMGFKNILLNLWNDDEKDFKIVTEDGKELAVHKCILRASSPVFAGMLKSGMKETIENKVEIKGFNLEIIETAMKYCYGLDIFNPLPLSIAMSLLHCTDIYDFYGLKDFLESFLINKMDATNVFELRECFANANSPELEKLCVEFLKNCKENVFCHVCETV